MGRAIDARSGRVMPLDEQARRQGGPRPPTRSNALERTRTRKSAAFSRGEKNTQSAKGVNVISLDVTSWIGFSCLYRFISNVFHLA
jgi:hypothetical protein